MGGASGSHRQFGEGPLARAAALVYTLLVVEVMLLVASVPGLAVLVLLDRDASNLPLVAACALPLGPALSAALYALRHRSRDLGDLRPAIAFWRGYRVNLGGALLVWVPWLAWMTVVAVNLTHLEAAVDMGRRAGRLSTTQQALLKCAQEAEARGWKISEEKNKWYQEQLAKNGMTVQPPSPQLKSDFRKIGDTMTAEWLKMAGADGQAIIDAYRK